MADPFQYLNQEANRTAANFSAIQQSLVQTRTMQLREQEQLFNQSLDLRKIDMLEKQNAFDNVMAQKKMTMLEGRQLQGDALETAKLESINALTDYRNAQKTRLEANQTAAENIPYPVNGTPQEIIAWDNQVNGVGAAIRQSWVDPSGSREVDGAYVPDPNDPMDMATAQAYREQGGSVADPSLPTDGGEEPMGALFGNAGASAGGLGGMRPFPPMNLDPNQKVVAGVAAATAAQTTPKDEFEQFFQAANRGISSTLANPNINEGARAKIASQMQIGLMRGAMQYRDNPKAKAYLNDVAPERDRVKAAAARGDEQMVQSIIRANEARLGSFNPILADAEAEGYAEHARLQVIEDSAKAQKAVRDELTSLTSQIKDMTTANIPVPDYMNKRAAQLMQQAYGNPVKAAEKTNRANQDRPR
jgi:hypothetical protein